MIPIQGDKEIKIKKVYCDLKVSYKFQKTFEIQI